MKLKKPKKGGDAFSDDEFEAKPKPAAKKKALEDSEDDFATKKRKEPTPKPAAAPKPAKATAAAKATGAAAKQSKLPFKAAAPAPAKKSKVDEDDFDFVTKKEDEPSPSPKPSGLDTTPTKVMSLKDRIELAKAQNGGAGAKKTSAPKASSSAMDVDEPVKEPPAKRAAAKVVKLDFSDEELGLSGSDEDSPVKPAKKSAKKAAAKRTAAPKILDSDSDILDLSDDDSPVKPAKKAAAKPKPKVELDDDLLSESEPAAAVSRPGKRTAAKGKANKYHDSDSEEDFGMSEDMSE